MRDHECITFYRYEQHEWKVEEKPISWGTHIRIVLTGHLFLLFAHSTSRKNPLMAWMINSINDKFFITVTAEKKNELNRNTREILIRSRKKGAHSPFYSSSKFEFLDFGIFLSAFILFIFVVVCIFGKWNWKKHKRKKGTASKNLHIDVIWARTLT